MARRVPNTTTFGFSDVCYAIYGSSNTSGRRLMQCFNDAQNSGFSYSGRNSLMDFRNYVHDTAAPVVDRLIATEVTNNSVTVSWSVPTDDVGVEVVRICRATPGGSFDAVCYLVNVNDTSYTFTNLYEDTEFDFFLRVEDAVGNISESPVLTIKTETTASISVSPSYFRFGGGGGTYLATVVSSHPWSTPFGAGFSPNNGPAGSTPVQVIALANGGPYRRVNYSVTNTGGASQTITIEQETYSPGGPGHGGLEPVRP